MTVKQKFGAIFDVDGTMVRNTPYHRQAWFELCRRYEIEMNDRLYLEKVHARCNDKIVANLFGNAANETLVRKIELEKETIYQDSFRPVMTEVPGLIALLKAFRENGIPCGVASNSPRMNVDFVLDALEIRPYFSTVINRDMVSVGKPNPEVLTKTATEMGMVPQDCLLFDDSSSGFAAARNAEMPYIAISTEPEEIPLAYDAKGIYEDFTEIDVQMLCSMMNPAL
ncbi:MAG: HAD family phosphatase [Planctomycetes bacterium]|nr:HAD family phosphatase [Planctomycetota bacterium]